MEWDLTWGPHVKTLEREKRAGKPVPALDSQPILFADLQWIYSAFMELNGSRRFTTAGAGPIPISEMKSWLDLYEISSAWDRLFFVQCILRMDEKFLDWQSKKASSLTSTPAAPPATKPSKPSKRH